MMRAVLLVSLISLFTALLVACTGEQIDSQHPEDGDQPVYDGDIPQADGDLDSEIADTLEADTGGDGDDEPVDGDDLTGDGDNDNPADGDGEAEAPDPLAVYGVETTAVSARHARVIWAEPEELPCTMQIERKLNDDYEPIGERDCAHGRLLDVGLPPQSLVQYRLRACDATRCGPYAYPVPTPTYPTSMPTVSVTVQETQTGDEDLVIFFGVLDGALDYTLSARLMAVDMNGKILWEMSNDDWGAITEVQLFEGRHSLAFGAYTHMIQLDLDLSVIAGPSSFTAHHDIDELSDGRLAFLFFDQFENPPDSGTFWLGDGIHILNPDGETFDFEWRGRDHIPLTDYNAIDIQSNIFNLGFDWTHANSITFDEAADTVYYNSRNLNRIYAIDTQSGAVRWTMGDGGDFGQGLWAHSHNPVFYKPGHVLIFDNGYQRGGMQQYSRVIDVAYDAEAKTAVVAWQYRETPDFYSFALGAVEFLPDGRMLVTDGMNGRLFIIDWDKHKTWEMRLPANLFIYKAVVTTRAFFDQW